MQLLFERSYEYGQHQGLGLIPGSVKKIVSKNNKFRVPIIGWCEVNWSSHSSILANPESPSDAFYFVHSYWCECL